MNKITILNNKTCNIVLPENQEILSGLRQLLSFKMDGVEYTQAYKNGWDGWNILLNKNGNFPAGLLSKVQSFLHEQNVRYELVDKRKAISYAEPIDLSIRLAQLNRIPRDYQLAITDAAFNNRRGIIRAATGSGKTLVAALITAKLNKPTIIYVIGLDLLQQFHQLFTDVFQQPIGYIGNGVCEIQNITIASIWSVGKALDVKFKMFDDDDVDEKELFDNNNKYKIQQLLKATEVHIFDECHSATCDTIKEIYKNIDPVRIYGMSGTPFKLDGSDLLINGIFGDQIINVSASDLIKRKILAQPIIKFINVPKASIHARTYAAVYNEYIVENEARNYMVLKETQNLITKGYQVLVLFKQIKHGKILYELFKNNNINCELLHGAHKLDYRQEIKDRLLNKELNVILASTIMDVGVDIPTLSALVLAGSGKSNTKSLQRIGRVIRGFPGKNVAAIVDFVDNVRFLKNHSESRYKIYSSEKGFIVKYPNAKY